jgi:N-acetylneuraminic acid mutarotase
MILLKNSIIYNIFCIFLLLLLNEVKSQTLFKPDPRNGHTSTLINNKLYILGGVIDKNNSSPKETFLYIDLSVPFNTNKITWHDLSSKNSTVPAHHLATTSVVNNTIFLFGGISLNRYEMMASTYKFDTQSNLWKIQKISGIPGKQGVTSIFDGSNIYLFGGSPFTYNINDMFIIKSNDLTWKKANLTDSPFPRTRYGAVLLPNKLIIYMGM